MRRIKFYLLLFVLGLCLNSTSQQYFYPNSKSKYKLGLEWGANLSAMQPEKDNESKISSSRSNIGAQLGLILYRPINKRLVLEGGVKYLLVWKDISTSTSSTSDSDFVYSPDPIYGEELKVDEQYVINYFQFPIKVNYMYNRLLLSGGAYYSRILKGKYSNNERIISTTRLLENKVTSFKFNNNSDNIMPNGMNSRVYSKNDFGLSLGIGYVHETLIVRLDYYLGLKNIIKNEETNQQPYYSPELNGSYTNNHKLRTWQLSVVYYLRTKRGRT